MEPYEIGQEVARLRRRRGLTQTELARRVGTKQPAIARIEQGHLPSLRTLMRIAEALQAHLVIRMEPLGDHRNEESESSNPPWATQKQPK